MAREIDLNAAAIDAALERFVAGGESPVMLFRGLIDAVRPRNYLDVPTAEARWRFLTERIRVRPGLRQAVRASLLEMMAGRRAVSFFSDAGILPAAGFFGEIWRRIAERLLPPLKDPSYLTDAVALIFHRRRDYQWFSELPPEARQGFWSALAEPGERAPEAALRMQETLLAAAEVLAVRIAAMGLEPELARVLPDRDEVTAAFVGLVAEMREFAAACRNPEAAAANPLADEKQLLVLVDQCLAAVARARRAAATQGTSLRLTYLLVRLEQSLHRLQLLAQVLAVRFAPESGDALMDTWTTFTRDAIRGVIRRDSVREQVGNLTGLLALRVTENAGRTGEHYIALDHREYFGMWRSAAGAGLIIACMALVKILAAKLELAPLNQAFVYSMNYALGFVLIHILHFTIATKQPAMTAATIAAAVSGVRGRLRDIERLADLVAAMVRSQIAAILGNVLVALPAAIAIAAGLAWWKGAPAVDPGKAFHLLADLDPVRSLALVHAAIAGVYLFIAGLISGYFDNLAAYGRLGERIAALRWLRAAIGAAAAARFGAWVDRNLGGLSGNFFFGIFLGATATVGFLFGLPLDIRHIAFAAANFGYALYALDFVVPLDTLLWSALGVALVGVTNLTVSFALALWVALKSHDVEFRRAGELFRLLGRRLLRQPGLFLLPPRATGSPAG